MKRRRSRLLSTLLVLCMVLALLPGTAWAAANRDYPVTDSATAFPDYRTVVQNIVNKYGVLSANGVNDMTKNTGIMDVFTADLTNDGEEELCVFYMDSTSDYGIKSEVYTLSNGAVKKIFEYRGVSVVYGLSVFRNGTENYFFLWSSRWTSTVYVWRNGDFITADMSKMSQEQKDYLAENSAINVGYIGEMFAREKIQLEILGLREGNEVKGFTFADTVVWDSAPTLKTLASMGVSPTPTAIPTIPAANTAYASPQTVELDGKKVDFQMYALKDEKGAPTNYIKARDLALALKGTQAEFSVDWAGGAVRLAAGETYVANGSENNTPFSGDRPYKTPTSPTYVGGVASDLQAIQLTDDSGGGYTYYQLRDLGRKLGFNVGWSAERGVYIESDKPYSG